MSEQEKTAPPLDVDAFLAGVKPDLDKSIDFYLVDRTNSIRQADDAAQDAQDAAETAEGAAELADERGDEAEAKKQSEAAKAYRAEAQKQAQAAREHRDVMDASKRTVRLRPADPDTLWSLLKQSQAGKDVRYDVVAATAVEPKWAADQWKQFGHAVGGTVFMEIFGMAQWVNDSMVVMPDFSKATSDLLAGLDSSKS